MQTKLSPFQFTNPRITKFNYSANIDIGNKKHSINITHTKSIKEISSNEALVNLDLTIKAVEKPTPFIVDMSICAQFKWGEMDYELVKDLLNQNAPSLLISFARPIILNFTCSSGFAPFYLPYIDFSNEPSADIIKADDTDNN